MKRLLALMILFLPQAALAQERLTLAAALDRLDRQNPTLKEAEARTDEALALVKQATVPLLPMVVASAGYVRNSDEAKLDLGAVLSQLPAVAGNPSLNLPAGVTMQPRDAFNVQAMARIPLLVPSAYADRSAARHGAALAKWQGEAGRARLRFLVKQAAWLAQAQREMLEAADQAVAIAQAHRDSAARAALAGTGAPLSVLRAKTEWVKRKSDRVRLRAQVAQAALALGVLLGQATPVEVSMDEAQLGTLPAPTPDAAASALALRPEPKLAQARAAIARDQSLSAKLRLVPRLSATAAAFASDEPYLTGKQRGWRLTVDATWDLFDGGLRGGKAAQARAQAAAAQAAESTAALQIAQEVADAARTLGVARERVALADEQTAFAREAAASASRSFEAGVAGSLEVLDANDRLYQAEVGRAEARGGLGVALATYEWAMGQ
jgi:outer membrane protein TolC